MNLKSGLYGMIGGGILLILLFLVLSCSYSVAQSPYYAKQDSITSNAAGTDSLAILTTGRIASWVGVTFTNSTTQDTVKVRGTWYGQTTPKTLSMRNLKNGSVDSVFIIPATAGLPHIFELMDPNVDRIEIYGLHAGNVVSGRVVRAFFRWR